MIAAVLLAAGESSRMGEPKQLLDWGGRPLVRAQVETLLNAGCRPVIAVVGAHAGAVRADIPAGPSVQIATNHTWREGRASSIRAGARAVPDAVDAVVIVSVDQPTSAAIVGRLASVLEASDDALIAVPRFNAGNGHPPIFDARLLPMLRSATERTEGLRALRRRYAEQTIFVDVDDPLVRVNLNTPEAYREARALL